jgi:glycine hydroxymethyltransferase
MTDTNDRDWLDSCAWLEETLDRHRSYRRQTLNLIASENVMSDDVARYYSLELGHRYGNYTRLDVGDRTYTGNRHLIELERRALTDACRLFCAGAADLRALSGHVAGSAAVMGLCEPDDLVLELDREAGGHRLTSKLCESRAIRLQVEAVPFDGSAYQVDVEATVHKIKQRRPRVVILGSSNYLFPTPLEDIAAACSECGTTLVMDASHVLGLIAGGQFPQPLDGGANLIIGSTHKTFGGPQGGIILGRRPADVEAMLPALFPGLVTNHHLMRIPALIALFSEWRTYGCEYARAMVAQAVALAEALEARGVRVVRTPQGPTGSQTLLLKVPSAKEKVARLEELGILTGAVSLPAEHGGEGIRLGVQELVRMGLQDDQIPELARLISDGLQENVAAGIRDRVTQLSASFRDIHFCHSHESSRLHRS